MQTLQTPSPWCNDAGCVSHPGEQQNSVACSAWHRNHALQVSSICSPCRCGFSSCKMSCTHTACGASRDKFVAEAENAYAMVTPGAIPHVSLLVLCALFVADIEYSATRNSRHVRPRRRGSTPCPFPMRCPILTQVMLVLGGSEKRH